MDNVRMISETGAIPENAVLIDLREREDYEAGHIPGAQLIPMGMLREEIRRIARFNTPILLYCYNGKKSGQAAELLQSRGYVNARNLGGINAYTGRLEPELTIREIREKKGLSQAALARMIGVRQPTVAAYESGKAHPGPVVCDAIRRMLTVTVCPADRESGGRRGRKAQGQTGGEKMFRLKKAMTIRELRNACGLTQAKFAESLGICAGSVAAYESGRTKPGNKVTEKIREVYGVGLSAAEPGERKRAKKNGQEKA